MKATIRPGIYDWLLFSNDETFYPPDLPSEWRLSFFSHEFDAACIDLTDFAPGLETLLEWVEDLPDLFQLSFLVNDAAALELLQGLTTQSDVSIHSILTQAKCSQFNDGLNSTGIRCVETDSLWSPGREDSNTGMALMPVQPNLKASRLWIEQWLQSVQNTESELTLWLPGAEYSDAVLSDIKTLIELMGH